MFANRLHLVALTPLQATKTGSKQPRSHFPPKRRLVPYAYRSFDLLWPISHCFRVTGPGVKKIPFLTDFRKKKVPGSCTLNFEATDRYTPKFSGVPYKSTWSQRFGLQQPPKSAYPKGCQWFWVFLRVSLDKIFPAKRSTSACSMSHIFLKLLYQRLFSVIEKIWSILCMRRHILATTVGRIC